MPTFRRLDAEEVAALRARRRGSSDLTEYHEFLSSIPSGEGGEVALGPEEPKRTIKRRILRAAQQQGKEIRYRRSVGDTVRFEVQ